MAGRQRTFDLVPTTLVRSHSDRITPMTSRQAKKAYQLANRGPKVSRAEQRRLDAEELERQKKEYERERAAAKAKAAREKKAAKENADKEARRKMGIPEPSRFVRASQPTISKFIRSGSTGKRSWQETKMEIVAEDSDGTLSETGFCEKDIAQPSAKRVATEVDSEDEFGDFPSLSQSDLLEKIDSSMASMNGSGAGSLVAAPKQPFQPACPEPRQELPTRKSSKDEYPFDDSELVADMVNTQLLSEAAEAAQRPDDAEFPELPALNHTTPKPVSSKKPAQKALPASRPVLPWITSPRGASKLTSRSVVDDKNPARKAKSPVVVRSALQELPVNMPPPPIPCKEKRAISFAPAPKKPKPLPHSTTKTHTERRYDIPPSATQVFLENNIEDFFPSPTQEIRELLEDVDNLPSNTQVARELSPEPPKEIPDISSPGRVFVRVASLQPIAEENEFDDLISTQDLILSSEELLEITTPSRPPPKLEVEPEVVRERPIRKPKPRFFVEKEEDILHAVLQESRAAAKQTQEPRARETRRTFFEEKEEDLLAAAIHESKILAERQEMVRVLLKESNGNENKKRTLKRGISSASTDYGGDEFSGDEWESFGL